MPAKDSKTVLVRVPIEIVEAAQKIKKDENLPTIGNAIRYWFEQQRDEQAQLQFSDIKIQLKEIAELHNSIADVLQHFKKTNSLACEATHLILGGNHLISEAFRKEMQCQKCPHIDKAGYLKEMVKAKQ